MRKLFGTAVLTLTLAASSLISVPQAKAQDLTCTVTRVDVSCTSDGCRITRIDISCS
jgi:hypothetical protein